MSEENVTKEDAIREELDETLSDVTESYEEIGRTSIIKTIAKCSRPQFEAFRFAATSGGLTDAYLEKDLLMLEFDDKILGITVAGVETGWICTQF